ncbi:bifunctional ADP-dependent NAD(P)H-hydrate dehydratase/NAD(P)H-hydrate epimerase [Maribacter hydrothermalis]|uniref:Bifunctional NAD(P)H-hydrate repair enzyme n=1 Tax=Maribacter hydrothermalis TaxID=1836467 RepID=A0A1B7YZZ3_9FLAO|nr:bifunctional ADP-dependent NAD(P)H-hydrate dehydratase/NAD(P)H-hydrate epimerase [Maribacter hydrothermalis]APQ16274.1 carbohydrate kinase [Maribacter hydrothermalis]OBR36038.1 carbohydrate kinase [Maribacter hydrothermalis]
MKLYSTKQIYKADQISIKKEEIVSNELMERAALQLFNWIHLRMQGAPVKIHLFCGIGNNGGDGIALARHLLDHGYNIAVYVVNYSEKRSKDFLINLDRLKDRKVWPNFMDSDDELPEINKDDIIVDGIFGIGLNRTPDTWVTKVIQHLNASQAFILSIDIPSGLFAERGTEDLNSVIRSNFVLSFQTPKLAFFLPESGRFIEQWEVLDIGLDPDYLMKTETDYELIGKNEVLMLYRPREKYAHKGTYGHSLIIGGSYGKIGAVCLTAKAALKVGSGLVTAFVPKIGYTILQTALPEIMVLTDSENEVLTSMQFELVPNVIGIGIGMGTSEKTITAFTKFLSSNKQPLVIDADALNIISNNKGLLEQIPEESILTPHPKELERLIGKWEDDFEKLAKVKKFSKKYKCIVVIKGAHTIVIKNEKGYVNTTGNPGMATAGSGDVLTGVITGLKAQGYTPLHAAIFGVYLHGKAGDIAVEKTGFQSLIASDLIENLGASFLDLFKIPEQPIVKQDNQ